MGFVSDMGGFPDIGLPVRTTRLGPSVDMVRNTPIVTPPTPINGWSYYDKTAKRLETYDGSAWQVYLSRSDLNSGVYPGSFTTLAVSGVSTVSDVRAKHVSSGDPGTYPATGKLVSIYYYLTGNYGVLNCYDWGAATYQLLNVNFSTLNFNPNGGAAQASISSTGLSAKNFGFSTYYNAGATTTIDWNNGGMQRCSVTSVANTFTLSNPVAGQVYTLVISNTSTSGSATFTFPSLFDGTTVGALSGIATGNSALALVLLYTGSRYIMISQDYTSGTTQYTYP